MKNDFKKKDYKKMKTGKGAGKLPDLPVFECSFMTID